MDLTTVVVGALAFFAIHVVLLAVLSRIFPETLEGVDVDPADGHDDAVDRTAGTVTCPDCRAENELGYTYCRDCVGELTVGASGQSSRMAPRRRGMF